MKTKKNRNLTNMNFLVLQNLKNLGKLTRRIVRLFKKNYKKIIEYKKNTRDENNRDKFIKSETNKF